eukprot:714372_1
MISGHFLKKVNPYLRMAAIFEDHLDGMNSKNEDVMQDPSTSRSRFEIPKSLKRLFSGVSMCAGFIFIISRGHLTFSVFLLMVQTAMFREVITVVQEERFEKQLPTLKFWKWFAFGTTIWISWGRFFMTYFNAVKDQKLFLYHSSLSCFFVILGFLAFVLTLKKDLYLYQFQQLGFVFIAILFTSPISFYAHFILDGLIWAVFPSSLCIANDVFAYIVGVVIGRTQLIKLSPNKTVEGFIGAACGTVLLSIPIAYYMSQFDILVCSKYDLDLSGHCVPDSSFVLKETHLLLGVTAYMDLFNFSSSATFGLSDFQLHGIIIALFASIISPFGGFFASGFKRAIGVKVFGACAACR